MKRFNKAFTLTELLIALGVIGILCAILLPVIFNLLPNQNTLMAKRAYYMVQTVVAEMINDEACYPDLTNAVDKRIGFDDGYGYANCLLWGGESATASYIETEQNPSTKFATLFTDKVETSDASVSGTETTFTTKGMNWKINTNAINTKGYKPNANIYITVDVNGTGDKNRPNCGQSTYSTALGTVCTEAQKNPDIFTMVVRTDGKITIGNGFVGKEHKFLDELVGIF